MIPPLLTCLALSYSASASMLPGHTGNLSRTYVPPGSTGVARFPSDGSGSDYATRCQALHSSYDKASSSWDKAHEWVSKYTQYYGGPSWSVVTDYRGATTLCDGHPRVPKSPAIPITTYTTTFNAGQVPTSTSVEPQTYGWVFPDPSPSCRIKPSDCDPLWEAYSTSLSSWIAVNATRTIKSWSQVTPPPSTPPCMNQSEASSWYEVTKSLYSCGDCTIFGDDVRLLFFPVPTTVSRDMCASTPSAKMTHFRIDDDALDVYAGKSYGQRPAPPGAVTATVDHHTLTSGTAYISIGKVYAQDRCSRDVGSTVKDVIIAMHSESILSLRYSQDHFQYFASSSTQTGYPISYADFNHPIPWSAWNGMAWCQGPAWGARCDIIYEDQYRPQLAIPGAIRKLNPRWSSCQNWYGGLYDPPLTLQTEHSFAVPTFSASVTTSQAPPTTTAEPASSVQNHPSSTVNSEISESPKVEQPGGIVALESSGGNGLEVPVPTRKYTIVTINGREYMVTPIDNGVIVGTQIVSAGGPVVRLADGSQAVFGSSGLVINAAISVAIKNGASLTFAGQTYMVQVTGKQSEVVNLGSATLSLGASPITLPNGAVATLGSNGIVVSAQTTISAGLLSGSSYTSTRTDSGKTSSSTAAVVTQSIKAPFTGSVYLSTASATESQSQSTSTSGGHAVLIRTAPLMVGILFALIQAIT